jgi:phosphomethylpyrimidine synthase
MTQMEMARTGEISPEMERVAKEEGLDPRLIYQGVAEGKIVIPANRRHTALQAKGIGAGLTIKVNANLGTSSDDNSLDKEIKKLEVALKAGADAIMDLSTGGDIPHIRQTLLANCPVPFGTVPIYQAAVNAVQKKGGVVHLEVEDLFHEIERQAQEGVDFMTLHCGITLAALERMRLQGRIVNIVSRGGAFLAAWMVYHKAENPLLVHFDRLLEIASMYDITLSLGDALRPGCLADATDRAQIQELIILGELTQRAWEKNVQVMIEGPGHVPLNQVRINVELQKAICQGAPFYVLGPLVTDVAAGYDHVACAIGGAVAGMAGADFLCYVTPAEHLKLPDIVDVREGVIAAKIAAQAADIARGNPFAIRRCQEMALARKHLDWDRQFALCIDPEKARAYRQQSQPQEEEACSMCGKFCAIKIVREYFNGTGDEKSSRRG